MGKIMLNEVQYSGLTNVEGAFIDTDNVIQANTTFTTSMSYTATKDCCVYILFYGNNTSSGFIKIGNKEVGKLSRNDSTGMYVGQYFYVKKGQTISAETPNVQGLSYIVYGIQSGSNVISAENNYSTDEQVVGKWVDGSDIYQKTVTFSQVGGNGGNWISTDVDISSLNVDLKIGARLLSTDDIIYEGIFTVESGILRIMHFRGTTIDFVSATIQYTKSS